MNEPVLSEGWADVMTKPLTWTAEEKHWRENFPVELGYGRVGEKTARIAGGQCIVHECEMASMVAYVLCMQCLIDRTDGFGLPWLAVYRQLKPYLTKIK